MSKAYQTGTPLATGAIEDFLQPFDMNAMQQPMQDMFQQSYVDPAMRNYREDILPEIQQRFASQGLGSSGALNQALARSAEMLATDLGGKYGDLMMNQQSRSDANRTNMLNMLTGLTNKQTFSPRFEDKQGWISQVNQILTMLTNAGKAGAGVYGAF